MMDGPIPPSIRTRLIGNGLVLAAFAAVTCFAGYHVIIGEADWSVPVMLMVPLVVSARANEQVREWKARKKRWDSFHSPSLPLGVRIVRGIMIVLAVPAAIAGGMYLSEHPEIGTGDVVRAWFGLWAVAAAIWLLLKLRRGMARPSHGAGKSRPVRNVAVEILVSKPRAAPNTIQDAYAALPDYCRELLGR